MISATMLSIAAAPLSTSASTAPSLFSDFFLHIAWSSATIMPLWGSHCGHFHQRRHLGWSAGRIAAVTSAVIVTVSKVSLRFRRVAAQTVTLTVKKNRIVSFRN